jgi:hypothetical protein
MLPQRELQSNIFSFIKNAPQALNHSLARPYLLESYSPFYLICALEILVLWIIFGFWFFRPSEDPYRHSVVLFCLFISLILLLLIGYIVPQLGAIVRYRSIFFPFLAVPLLASIRWKKNE